MKNIMLVFFLLFLLLIVGANIYLANRIAFYLSLESAKLLYIVLPIFTFLMFFGMMGLINSTTSFGNLVFGISAVLIGFLLYVLVSAIAVDIINIFAKLQPGTSGLVVLSVSALISIYGLWNATNTKTNEVDIEINNLSKPIRAAHLTDTHIGHFRGAEKLDEIVNTINEQKVDVVFFTGDLMDSKIQLKPESLAPLKNLDAPIYFVEGNHDVYTGTDPIKNYLRSNGVVVLSNEMATWSDLTIIGLDHMVADNNSVSPHANADGPTVQSTLKSIKFEQNKPSVLLHHSPDGIKYAQENGIDLYLAGHTHGGQLWPITHIADLMFEVNKGLHTFGDTQVYVSQGTGTFGPPMRVGTYSELTILNLIPKNDE